MIYTPLTIKAMQYAYAAHHGQQDYNGVPYILHPVHLAEQMEDEISCAAALLHDVVEDTPATFDDLRAVFPEAVVEVVTYLTHDDETDYFDYVRKIRENPIAMKVKLADIAHNSDPSRAVNCNVPPEKLVYWKKKYARARAILMGEAE